jgi:hypothetical protein
MQLHAPHFDAQWWPAITVVEQPVAQNSAIGTIKSLMQHLNLPQHC